LDCPHYTRPRVLDNKDSVPDVLLSGDHKKINAWRYKQKLVRTYLRRKDMFNALHLSDKDKEIFENLEGKFNSEGK
jgi:tRNA (guanine37-N1)-methyltransferase